ncbi:hypothetical protein BDM02DRAFT_3101690 [Thelephora ganbajun]|uniref:Uncharacterized protein n=1 Tax=Thelephora ganbajun TaxID=370292 RepID=A0ACB6Z6K2_THEGA|nr:hypothetical protein BDM02DRAFT_3101690 [Thelephora ganbajun]
MAATDPSNKGTAEAFNSFPFDTDQEYQTGLRSILSSNAFNNESNMEKENTLRLSRVFYFNKVTGNSITLDDALSFESSVHLVDRHRPTEQQQQQAVGEEPPTLTFAELKALIEQGKTDGIPNNKLIPNILNNTPPSENTGQIRRKPWET